MPVINKKLVTPLVMFHIGVIALANYTVQFTGVINIFGGVNFTWGTLVFPLVIIAADLTVRLSGRQNARVIAAIAWLPAILISAHLANWRIGVASGCAYLVGQLLDIAVFAKIRARAANWGRRWWTAPMISTACANVADTYLFYGLAFYRASDAFMAEHWLELAAADLTFKLVVSALVFLPLYGIVLNLVLRWLQVSTQTAAR